MNGKVSTNKMNYKQLKIKAAEFLSSITNYSSNLVEIINQFQICVEHQLPVSPYLLAVEQIFAELLRRRDMFIVDAAPTNSGSEENSSPNVATAHREWLQERYRDALRLVLASFTADRIEDSTQALVTAVRLIGHEGRYPLDQRPNAGDNYYFPVNRFRNILQRLLASDRPNRHLLNRFKEYGQYLDVLHYAWKLLPGLTMKGKSSTSDIYIQNYLDLVAAIPIKADVLQSQQYLCYDETTATVGNAKPLNFDYATVRKCLNKSWQCTAIWKLTAQTQKQMLILLLEHVMSQLDKPVLLTDFLMDSLDVGGPISLLALQGVFTLIQQHNLTYPNIYEKLYSMFEPEIFHTKFKARLFYLADIFLSSISLPEMLVAAFVKRLARLSLVAPPQDIVIILYFIGNLIIRHPGLKRLICHPDGGQVVNDPYVMGEMEPIRSMALDSSLWEVVLLQNHAMPSIAQAARFISAPLPTTEWDLSNFLELNEDDIFDQQITKRSKECALSLERPSSMFNAKSDHFTKYWKMC